MTRFSSCTGHWMLAGYWLKTAFLCFPTQPSSVVHLYIYSCTAILLTVVDFLSTRLSLIACMYVMMLCLFQSQEQESFPARGH